MESVEIAIVGAGPVGMTLAALLSQRGVSIALLEARTVRSPHSRAIGIHPPTLEVLNTLGLWEAFRDEGVAIDGGRVFYGDRRLGRLTLSDAPLALPQARTEALLESRLATLAPRSLRRGMKLTGLKQCQDSVQLFCQTGETLTAKLVVGCDGTKSTVRTLATIGHTGSLYPDRYLLGDFADDTEFGTDAVLFFSPKGIVESFPLPKNRRRWVARLTDEHSLLTTDTLASIVFSRTRRHLPVETCSWLSPFGIEEHLADTFLQGRVALAGDAAHVVSPFGGQGMNLGILGAKALADAWDGTSASLENALATHRHLAQRVARRARFNLLMGRPLSCVSPRRALITVALALPPVSRRLDRAFTMCDLA